MKYCECGCGQLMNETDNRGRVRRFINNHRSKNHNHMLGKSLPAEWKKNIGLANIGKKLSEKTIKKMTGKKRSQETRMRLSVCKRGIKNPNYISNGVLSYTGIHNRVKCNWPSPIPEQCEIDGCTNPPYDLANVSPYRNSETYTDDINNWWWACRSCHMTFDGRINNLKQNKSKSC